jgi:acetyl-CoA C-acetyltransferase
MIASVQRGLDPNDIEALYLGNYSSDLFEGQGHLAPIMADWIGLTPKPATRIEDACASGGVGLRQGVLGIASGMYDVVLVGGVEKMTSLPTERVTDALVTASDILYEAPPGFTFPGLYAAMATAYMDQYGARPESFMAVAIQNHENGALNPKAQFTSTIKQIMEGRIARARERGGPVPTWQDESDFLHDPQANPVVAWPMRLFDCSPVSDGAACVLLVAEELARSFTDTPVAIIGSGQGSAPPLHTVGVFTSIPSAKTASHEAYAMAGVTPRDIQLAEVHDCFTIAELVAIEDLGFFEPGQGYKAVEEGMTARDGAKPINTSGGLKAKGHPVGASGVAQVAEVWEQMTGRAGRRQVPSKDIHLALTHNVGASGGTCAVHIFERR